MEEKLRLKNSRSTEQTLRMKSAQEKGLCPFCPDGLKKIHKMPIELSTGKFYVTRNAFPYSGTKYHFLIIPKKHITKKFNKSDWAEIGFLINTIIDNYSIIGGSLFLRFGDMKKNGSSIEHNHVHIIEGESTDEGSDTEGLKVKLGFKKISHN